jgi:hypothetical protein
MSLVTRLVCRCSAAAAAHLRSTTLLPSPSFLFQNSPTLNPSLSSSCRRSASPPANISPLFSLHNQRDRFPAAPSSRSFSSGDHLRQVVQKNASPVEYVQASSAPFSAHRTAPCSHLPSSSFVVRGSSAASSSHRPPKSCAASSRATHCASAAPATLLPHARLQIHFGQLRL